MPSLKADFGGLILDKPITQLPEGTARTAINVDWQTANGALGPRSAFASYGSVSGGSLPSKIVIGGLNDGQPYIFVKVGGTVNGLNDGGIVSLLTGLSITEPGGFFSFGGELYYFDQSNRWIYDKANGNKYECGMDPPVASIGSVALNGTTVSKGGMFGAAFRYAVTYYDPKRDLETFPAIGNGTMFTDWINVDLTSDGLEIMPPSVLSSPNDNYTKIRLYRTRGFTETMGVTQAREFYTLRSMLIAQIIPGVKFTDLNGDSELQSRTQQLLYHGTPPPRCSIAVPFGDTVIYLEEEKVSAEQYRPSMYWSLPGKPGMVPKEYILSGGNRPNRVVTPLVGQNRAINPVQGKITATFHNGGRTLLFTRNEIYRISGSAQRPTITPMEVGVGTPHQLAVSPTMSAIGLPFWDGQHVNILTNTGVSPIDTKFGVHKLFKDLTGTERDLVRVGSFSGHNQIWVSYGTEAQQNILVMDYEHKKSSIFQIAGKTTSIIAGMCELVDQTKKQMLVFFNDRKVYNYPADTGMMDEGTVFNTTYRAVFGQDTIEREKEVEGMSIQMGDIAGGSNPPDTVDVALRGFDATGFLRYVNDGVDLDYVSEEGFDDTNKNTSNHIRKFVSTVDATPVNRGTVTGNILEVSITTTGNSKWRWETWGLQRLDVHLQGGATSLTEKEIHA